MLAIWILSVFGFLIFLFLFYVGKRLGEGGGIGQVIGIVMQILGVIVLGASIVSALITSCVGLPGYDPDLGPFGR